MQTFAALIGAVVIGSEPPALPGGEPKRPYQQVPYSGGVQIAGRDRSALVTFVDCPARPVDMDCLVAHVTSPERLPGITGPCIVVCVFGPGVRISYALPADATDAQIQAKAAELRASLRPPAVFLTSQPPTDLRRFLQGFDPSCRTG